MACNSTACKPDAGTADAAAPDPGPIRNTPRRISMDDTLTLSRDLGQRALRLVEGLHAPDDLSPARLEQVFGQPVRHSRTDPQVYGFGRTLDARWICNVMTLPRPAPDAPLRLEFAFDDQTDAYDDLSAVAGLDFDACAAAMAAAGYVHRPATGGRDMLYGHDFLRGPVSIRVRVRAESAAHPDHLCVESLIAEVRHA